MNRFLFVLLFVSTFLFVSLLCAETQPGIDEWLSFYYTHPQPECFVEQIRAMSKAGYFEKDASRPPLLAFLGRVMAQNPDKIGAWMAALADLPVNDRDVLNTALWFSGTKEGARFLEVNGIRQFAGKTPPDILNMEIDSPAVLDMLWAWFFATGREEAIRRIVSAMNLSRYEGALDRYKTAPKTEQARREAFMDSAYRSAGWSLANNCRLHPRVREICEKLYREDSLNTTERSLLGAVLAKAAQPEDKQPHEAGRNEAKPVPDSPNMKSMKGFGAQLLLTDNTGFFKDWSKPDALRLAPLNRVGRNVRFYTVILFSDPGVDASGSADVSCTIAVHSPDGSVYARSGNQVCWKGKYEVPPHNLQLSKGELGMRLEAKDSSGIYTVNAIVVDNVKKVELPLTTTFELQ